MTVLDLNGNNITITQFQTNYIGPYFSSRSNSNDSNSSGLTVILDSPAMVFQPKRSEGDDNNEDDVRLVFF